MKETGGDVFSNIEFFRNRICKYPLDRGKALIYRKEVNRRARAGVDLWTLFGMRAGIPKDIRLLIAKLIWENRCDWIV